MGRFCPNCGSEVDFSWKVCQKCGTSLELEATPQPTPQPYAPPAAPPYGAPPQYPPGYQQYPPGYQYGAPGAYGAKGSRPKGTISLILALLGFLCCCCCSTIGGIVMGVIAMVFGMMGLKEDQDKGFAKTGLILGIIDIIVAIAFFVLYLVFFGSIAL